MAKIDLDVSRNADNESDEALVPLFLRITLCVSSTLGATPARLRRARNVWWLTVSPRLVKLQRLFVIISNATVLSALTLDFLSEKHRRVRIGETVLTGATYIFKTCLIVFVYSLGVLTGPRHLKHNIFVLQQMHKIKTSLKRGNQLKYSKAKHVSLILYMAWQLITFFILYNGLSPSQNLKNNILVFSLYSSYGYQVLVIALLQQQWSMIMIEISSTLTLLNDELEILLKHATSARQRGIDNEHVAQLQLNYDTICVLLRQVDRNSGLFLLCNLFLMFVHLLITPYNLIAMILCTNCATQYHRYIKIAMQFNWMLTHTCHLLIFMEPCHWLQEQCIGTLRLLYVRNHQPIKIERTGHLLNRLLRQATRRRLDRTQLDAFLLQTQMNDCNLAPCGVFTITRPLLASIVGGVTTYLIIIIQFQTIKEEL